MNWEIVDFGSIALNWPWSGSEIKNCQVVCTLVQWTGAGIKDCQVVQEPCRVAKCQTNLHKSNLSPQEKRKNPDKFNIQIEWNLLFTEEIADILTNKAGLKT